MYKKDLNAILKGGLNHHSFQLAIFCHFDGSRPIFFITYELTSLLVFDIKLIADDF